MLTRVACVLTIVCGLQAHAQPYSIFDPVDPVSAGNCTERVEGSGVNQAWGSLEGVLQFRGNPSRTWYGTTAGGSPAMPADAPQALWKYPKGAPLTTVSKVKAASNRWTGTGWTGQPVVWVRPDTKRLEVIVGAFDRQVHFIDAETGEPSRPPFSAGDLVKGSVTLDPDGYPILYFGAVGDGGDDGFYRALALDREPVRELWKQHANDMVPKSWYKYSGDWDGNASVVNDHLIIGAEIGYILGWKLNRGYDPAGKVTVNPEMVLQMPSELPEISRRVGNRNTGIESSCAMDKTILYCANGQGRVMGVDLSQIDEKKQAKLVFDFWAGDDIDASPIVDAEGFLYIAVEHERLNDQNKAVGQLLKIDPRKVAIDPKTGAPDPFNVEPSIVWRIHSRGVFKASVNEDYTRQGEKGGFWATPALDAKRHVLYIPSHRGQLLAVDTRSGNVLWQGDSGFQAWSSPNIVGDTLVVGQCLPGGLAGYDISDPSKQSRMWLLKTPDGGCVESSAAVHHGRVYVGTRGGYIYAFGWR